MIEPAGISHMGICVRNLERSLKFYRDILGMKVTRQETQDMQAHFGDRQAVPTSRDTRSGARPARRPICTGATASPTWCPDLSGPPRRAGGGPGAQAGPAPTHRGISAPTSRGTPPAWPSTWWPTA
jgi:catechol 2,3-dioxygenase-like lactoylglutathione lyase family enzyme